MSEMDVDGSINSGQVFLWRKIGESWYGVDGQNVIRLNKAETMSGPTADFARCDDDMGRIVKSISRDAIVRKAVAKYPGLRIFRQDPFQCLISFVVSSNSSIQKIRTCLDRLCRMYGDCLTVDGEVFYAFPRPESLAGATAAEIAKCGTGYRSGFVRAAARMVASGEIDLQGMRDMEYLEARDAVCAVPGVGYKVADCVMLFSLEKPEAFPIDRWTTRILRNYYHDRFSLETKTITQLQYSRIHEEIVDYFGPYAGYAQQFLFKMERERLSKKW